MVRYPDIPDVPNSPTLTKVIEDVNQDELELGTVKKVTITETELKTIQDELGGIRGFALVIAALPFSFEVSG